MKNNTLIHADALTVFERIESESIDLVYLDPPWFSMEAMQKDKKQKHDEKEHHIEFIYKILQQAKRVLKDTGSLVFHSEPLYNIKFQPLIAKVFKTENFIQEYVIPQRKYRGSQKHSTMLFYGKSEKHYFDNQIKMTEEEINSLFPYLEKRGHFQLVSPFMSHNRPTLVYEWNGVKPPSGSSWKYPQVTLEELFEQGNIETSRSGRPMIKRFVNPDSLKKEISTVWHDITTFHVHPYNKYGTSQPEELIKRVIGMTTKENNLVLDPFCGSGTSLVVSSKMDRNWIGVDNSILAMSVTKERLHEYEFFNNFTYLEELEIKKEAIIWNNYVQYERVIITEEDKIMQMIANDETDTVEFKESAAFNYNTKQEDKTHLSFKVLRAIASFANNENGGILLIGIKDKDKQLIDLAENDYKTANRKNNQDGYKLYLLDKIKSQLGAKLATNCDITFHTINYCDICMIKVRYSKQIVFLDGKFFIRSGNRTIEMNNEGFFEQIKNRYDLV